MLISQKEMMMSVHKDFVQQPEMYIHLVSKFLYENLHDWNIKDKVTVTFIPNGVSYSDNHGDLVAIEVSLEKETGDLDHYTDEEIEQINRESIRRSNG